MASRCILLHRNVEEIIREYSTEKRTETKAKKKQELAGEIQLLPKLLYALMAVKQA
jgi:hypothetical protein